MSKPHGIAMSAEPNPQSLSALDSETLRLLRQLAVQNLQALGVSEPGPYMEQEMIRNFSTLANAIPAGENREDRLREAIRRAIEEAGD